MLPFIGRSTTHIHSKYWLPTRHTIVVSCKYDENCEIISIKTTNNYNLNRKYAYKYTIPYKKKQLG